MEIHLNGRDVQLAESVTSVEQLLKFYRLESRIVIVELNQTIINKEQYPETSLSKGDKVELIHFVGGG